MRNHRRLFVLGIAAVSLAPTSREERDEALRLYKAGQYDEACPIYERLATTGKTNGALWADLGLCEFKRGRPNEGKRASLLAVQFGNEKTRKNAYFNLYSAGVRAELPVGAVSTDTACGVVSSTDVTCETPMWTCRASWSSYGSGSGGTLAFFGASAETRDAVLSSNDPGQLEDSWLFGQPFLGARLWLTSFDLCLGARCSGIADNGILDPFVHEHMASCFLAKTGIAYESAPPDMGSRATPELAKLHDALLACNEEAWSLASNDRPIWKAPETEVDAGVAQQCSGCTATETFLNEVVAIDACHRRVGYAEHVDGEVQIHELNVAVE